MQQRYVIVGANLAGGTAAITLREEVCWLLSLSVRKMTGALYVEHSLAS